MRIVAVFVLVSSAVVFGAPNQGAPAGWSTYVDPAKRFAFNYPPSFGQPERGTDSGFRNRVAAVRFSGLVGLGGEAVVTSGFIDVDVQTLGGLYDSIARGVLQDADVPVLVGALPPIAPSNFCSVLGSSDRVQGLKIAPRLLGAAKILDAMRNLNPLVHRCTVTGGVVVFHKETTFQSGAMAARQHLYGALRFLDAPYSSFQIVRGLNTPPSDADVTVLEQVVRSFKS
jgi:hypothetical protein